MVADARECTWAQLPDEIARLAEGVATKAGAPGYSLVTLRDVERGRCSDNIDRVYAVSLDFDSGAPPWESLDAYSYVAYTTARHTTAAPRWRVHIQLTRPASAAEYAPTARSVAAELGAVVDLGASNDAARLWYAPLESAELRVNDGARVAPIAAAEIAPVNVNGIEAIDAHDWPASVVADHVAQVWAEGVRHNTARALGGYLARRGWDDESIVSVIDSQEADPDQSAWQSAARGTAARVREGMAAPGWADLTRMFGEVWSDALALHARHPREPDDWHLAGVPWTAWWARNLERLESRPQPTAVSNDSEIGPLLIGYGRTWWLRDDVRGGYYSGVPRVNVMTRLANAGIDTYDPGAKKQMTLDAVTRDWGTLAEHVEYHFAARGISWDDATSTLRIGYDPPEIEPRYDADVSAWLDALFGPQKRAALEWIAACAPRYSETHLTAALVIIGRGNTGKTVLATALARMWGAASPVGVRDACAQFNGPSIRCPILLDDECAWIQQRQMTSQEFLERIQQWERPVELKGQEKLSLHGAQRTILTANNVGSVRFSNVRGIDSLDAASDRMAWHANVDAAAAQAALSSLRLPHDYRIDLDRVCSHIAHIWETVAIPRTRFVGACESEGAREALQADAADRYATVYTKLREAWEASGEEHYRSLRVDREERMLYVHPPGLCRHLEPMPAGEVRRALEAIAAGKSARQSVGGKRLRCWAIPADRIPE